VRCSQITRKPLQVFKWPTLLLGKTPECPIAKWYKEHFYSYALKEAADGRGGIALSVPGGGGFDAEEYTAEELVGQILAHGKMLAESTAEEAVKEAVITVRAVSGRPFALAKSADTVDPPRSHPCRFRRSGDKTSGRQSWTLPNWPV
jgi:hypothetical protein